MTPFHAEQPENFERKLPLIVAIDVSGSMGGNCLDEVNQGLKILETEIMADSVSSKRVDLCLVTFNHEIRVARDFDLVTGNSMPSLVANGSTRLVDGVREAVKKAKERIDWYWETGQDCYRPYLLILTDGAPDPGQDNNGLSSELANLHTVGYDSPKNPGHQRKFHVMAFGVDGADMNMLRQISPTEPKHLKSEKFKEFFVYIATVSKAVSKSTPGDKINISPAALKKPDPFSSTS